MATPALRRDEIRVILGTGSVYGLRMLGLYMALPVMATWAATLPGQTHLKIGLCLGAYGLTQAIFQIPFGRLGDVAGRRVVIFISFLLFAAGSAIVATASSIDQVILGRLVQGTAAMASSVIALVGDATREEVRTRAMALIGLPLGICFAAGFVLGPIEAARFGVPAIFWVACALSLGAAALFPFAVPSRLVPRGAAASGRAARGEATWSWVDARALLGQPSLLVLDLGIAALHACVTGVFVVVPFVMRDLLIPDGQLWRVYAPAIAAGMAAMAWASHHAEKPGRVKRLLRLGAVALGTGLVLFALFQDRFGWVVIALCLFVVGFGMLEPVLTALVTRYVRRSARGTAAGVFNLSQFVGAFGGGLLAGWLLGAGRWAPFAAMAVLVMGWLGLLPRLRDPAGLALSEFPAPGVDQETWPRLQRLLLSHPAVLEAEWATRGPVTVSHWVEKASPREIAAIVERAARPLVAASDNPPSGA